ncbi:hypothetical protein B0H12DRAFT_1070981 [Mycena haematopus]|nr:hypothetical protein B0H12DRAFT_1073556 [Mycena haematopus]KAJ7248115.1 hypothetical protein B0H12DRAFT_1072726 [Mycena haematopus]KAJ7255527.1 hypothetical protein B0H12DRAFT_1070981 [Mycena haematopus]
MDKQHQGQLTEKDRLISATNLEGKLAQGSSELVETASVRDKAQARCKAAEETYRQALSGSTRSKQELESAAGDADLRAELARTRSEHARAVERLHVQVASAVSDAEDSSSASGA